MSEKMTKEIMSELKRVFAKPYPPKITTEQAIRDMRLFGNIYHIINSSKCHLDYKIMPEIVDGIVVDELVYYWNEDICEWVRSRQNIAFLKDEYKDELWEDATGYLMDEEEDNEV